MQHRFVRTFFICCMVACIFSVVPKVHADAPLAARLLSIPYDDTASGGLRVTVNNLSGLRALTNDGTTVYLLDGSGNIVTVPMSSLVGSPGSAITVDGTVHAVEWGVGGAPSFTFALSEGRSLSYSHGCLFFNDDISGNDPIHLYCIDTSDWSVTPIAVPADKPLPEGHSWAYATMIDFADGRIGKVSAYAATSTPSSGYSSYIRMYTVTGTGKNATIAFSHDYYMFDSDNWNLDDHGIATDGTYIYRIEYASANAPGGDFKSWPLQEDGAPSQEYVGSYTQPFGNMTYLTHDHIGNRYLVGNYGGDQFYITSASDPGPGPGNPLTPAFSAATSAPGGYTVQVTNYDASFSWSASVSAGSVSIDDAGHITVTGLSAGETATTTVTASKSGVADGSAEIAASSTPDTAAPVISAIATSTTAGGVAITWNTDEDASTKVVYSVDEAYASSTAEADTAARRKDHSVTISDLLPCTYYNYKVVSGDAAGNYATSSADTFHTTGCSGDATPLGHVASSVEPDTQSLTQYSRGSNAFSVRTPENFTATSSSVVIHIVALPSDTALVPMGAPSSNYTSVGLLVYDVKALLDNVTPLDSVNAPLTVSYLFSPDEVDGIDLSRLWLYHYHGGEWLPLDNCVVNESVHYISCETQSFSLFALFASTTPAQAQSGVQSAAGALPWCSGPSAPGWNSNLPDGGCGQASPATNTGTSTAPAYHFTRDLEKGMTGPDVRALQQYLNTDGFVLAQSGAGSPGSETDYFGTHTFNALVAFQNAHAAQILAPLRLAVGTGYFGSSTRAFANASL